MFYSCARRFVSVTLMTSLLSSSVIPAFAGIDDDNDVVSNKAVVSTKASVPGVPDERTDFSTGMNILLDVVGSQNPVLVGEILKYLPLQDRLNLMRSGPSVTEKDTDAVKTLREKFMKLQGAVSLFNKTDGEYRITEDLIAKNPHLFAKGARRLVIDRVKEGQSGVNSFGPQCPSLQKVKFLDFSTATDYGLADFLNNAISGALAKIHLNILHSLDFNIDSEDAVTEDVARELLFPVCRWKEVNLTEEIIPSAIERLNSLSASAKYPKTVLTVLQKFKATFFNEWNQDLRMPPQVALFLNADAEPTSEDYVALRKFLRKYVHVFTRNDVIAGSVVPNGGVGLDPVWFLSVNAYTLCFAKDLFLQGEAPSLRIALLSVLSKYQPTTLRETIEHAKVMFTPDMTSQDKGKIIDALAQVRPSWRAEIVRETLSMTGGMNADGKASMVEQRHVDKYSKTLSRVSFDDLRTTFYPAGAPGGAAWIPSEMLALMEVLRFSPPQNHTSALKHIKSLSLDSLSFERKRDVFRDLLSYPAAKHEDLVRYVRELTADATASFPDIFKNLVAIDPVRLDSAMTHGRKLWKNGEAGTFKAEIIKILASFPITHHEGVSRHVASFVPVEVATYDQIVSAISFLGLVPAENLESAVEHAQKLFTPGMPTESKLQIISCLGLLSVDRHEEIVLHAVPFMSDAITLEEIQSVIGALTTVPSNDFEDVMAYAQSFFTPDMTIEKKMAYVRGIGSVPTDSREQIINLVRTLFVPRVNLEEWQDLCIVPFDDWKDLFTQPVEAYEISYAFELLSQVKASRLDQAVESALRFYEEGKFDYRLLYMIKTFGEIKPARHDAIISLFKAVMSNPPSIGDGNALDESETLSDKTTDSTSHSGSDTHTDDDSSSHSGSAIDADDDSASGSQQDDIAAIDTDANDQFYGDVQANINIYDLANMYDRGGEYGDEYIVEKCASIFAKVSVSNIAKAIRFAEPFLTSKLDWGSKANLIYAFTAIPEMSDGELETFQNHLKKLFDYKGTLKAAASCIQGLHEISAELRGAVIENFAHAITEDQKDREAVVGLMLFMLSRFPVEDMKEAAPLISQFFAVEADESSSEYSDDSSNASDAGYYTAQNSDSSSESDGEYDSFSSDFYFSDSTDSSDSNDSIIEGVIDRVSSEKRLAFIKKVMSLMTPAMNLDQRLELLKRTASDMGAVLVRDELTPQSFESASGTESDDELSSQSSESIGGAESDDESSPQSHKSTSGTESDDGSDDELSSQGSGSFEADGESENSKS